MALHQAIQRVLLVGTRLNIPPPPPPASPPERLLPLIEALAPAHLMFDARAVHYGHRYRSGFWAIYLLSAIAVLFAVLPLALGWDDRRHLLHPTLGLWALAEVLVIGTVSMIYWLGHRRDWQGQWLRARTAAELIWYLPLVAPLIDFTQREPSANWYMRVFDPGNHLRSGDELETICSKNESLARTLLDAAWSDPAFVSKYAIWTTGILEAQAHYHHRVSIKQHALLHRVHSVNIGLFGFTALGALAHLAVHTVWLSVLTTFFPALGASLHGALAQSEAYRLGSTSERLWGELQGAIGSIRATLDGQGVAPDADPVKESVMAAIELILEEHQDWHMLVRPHHLPLA
ncbi:MAG TPA: hypothetical protein VHU43_01045 [Steroidobacteraceae bacterium]|jgi:hypothetical protein|nr:hypothetical protein [Steroidobacteraceae bacterium]